MNKFLVVCDHATVEVMALDRAKALEHCRCAVCRITVDYQDGQWTYRYKDVRVYRGDVNLTEPL